MPTDTCPAAPPPGRAWTRDDVATFLVISVSTLDDLRKNDSTFPQPVMIGTLPRWRSAEVIAWFNGMAEASSKPSDRPAPVPTPAAPKPARGARRGQAA